MSGGVERILARALMHARQGATNPHLCLIWGAEDDGGDTAGDCATAFMAVRRVAGQMLFRWYAAHVGRPQDTVELLEETLFQVQLGA